MIGTWIILAHAYFHVDQDIIGTVVNRDVPVLKTQLEAVVTALGDSE